MADGKQLSKSDLTASLALSGLPANEVTPPSVLGKKLGSVLDVVDGMETKEQVGALLAGAMRLAAIGTNAVFGGASKVDQSKVKFVLDTVTITTNPQTITFPEAFLERVRGILITPGSYTSNGGQWQAGVFYGGVSKTGFTVYFNNVTGVFTAGLPMSYMAWGQ